MREIKFRAWGNNNICFDGEGQINLGKKSMISGIEIINGLDEMHIEPSGLTFMQYTGLKDKNGVEIYEGDIVECTYKNGNYVAEVIFDKRLLRLCLHVNMDKSEYVLGLQTWEHADVKEIFDLVGYNFEVIGNIYENKELLA